MTDKTLEIAEMLLEAVRAESRVDVNADGSFGRNVNRSIVIGHLEDLIGLELLARRTAAKAAKLQSVPNVG